MREWYTGDWTLGYETYLTNGFDNASSTTNKTVLSVLGCKANNVRFEESSSGRPLVTARVVAARVRLGRSTLSYMGGIYNKFQEDGLALDRKRRLHTYAVDFNTTFPGIGAKLTGEWAWITIDVPETYGQQFGAAGRFSGRGAACIPKRCSAGKSRVQRCLPPGIPVDWNTGRFRKPAVRLPTISRLSCRRQFQADRSDSARLNYRYQRQRTFWVIRQQVRRAGNGVALIFKIDHVFPCFNISINIMS
ncbi:MAG: hypothetical protein IPL27_03530 [Lewinellaceae bacterium]|nr:hypothetical protein [Lewinellaceae bacterium]